MKKIKFLLIFLITIFAVNMNIHAASANLSVSSSNVYAGDDFTVTVRVNAAAAWNVHVSASGPVTGCVIKQADASVDAMNTNKTFSATCSSTGIGTITVKLSGDVTSADDGNAIDISGSRNVTVSQRPATPAPNPTPQPSNPNNNKPQNNLSTNNKIKELLVEGYELVKVDNNNYTLIVSNDITAINVVATAEDAKAKLSGIGIKELQVGENNIEVIVTSESGVQNKINIKVTRKDGYYLEDLDLILKNEKLQDADIIINADSKITKEQIKQIKDSKKTIRLNYYNENKKLIYSWTIIGKNIKEEKELITNVTYTSENAKEIYELSNYADGLYIKFSHNGELPTNTKVKLYVGDKFENGSSVNIYHYNGGSKTLDLVKNKLKVTDGYVEFNIEHCSEYFVTMSTIGSVISEKTSFNIFMIFTILELIIIVGLVIFIKVKPIKNNI